MCVWVWGGGGKKLARKVVMGNMHALWYFPVGHTARTGKAWFVREITGEGEGVQGSCKGKSVLCDTRGTFMIRFSAMLFNHKKAKIAAPARHGTRGVQLHINEDSSQYCGMPASSSVSVCLSGRSPTG